MAVHKYGVVYARDLEKRRIVSRRMLSRFIYLAEVVLQQGVKSVLSGRVFVLAGDYPSSSTLSQNGTYILARLMVVLLG